MKRTVFIWRYVALLCLLAPAGAVEAACSAGPQKWMAAQAGYYDSYEAGDVVVDWMTAPVAYYVDCDPISSAQMMLRSATGFAGFHQGRTTFRTDHEGIGIQMEYRYVQSINGAGQPVYSEWQEPGTAGTPITAHAHYVKGTPTAPIIVEVDYRFIALREFSGETIAMGDLEPLVASDRSYGFSLEQLSVEGPQRRLREIASCSFSARPPTSLRLPDTHTSLLKNTGDMGEPADFSFSWSCRAGNQGHSGRGDFRFRSADAITDSAGHLATSGDAKGVDMLVTLERSDGTQEPIVFETWYANHLSPGTGGLPSSGSQAMQVRFIRNASPLVPGTASSTLTIEAIPF